MQKKQNILSEQKEGTHTPKTLRFRIKNGWGEFKVFFRRLFYIARLVYETSPWILLAMTVLCVVEGLFPILAALIQKELLNEIVRLMQWVGDSSFSAKDATELARAGFAQLEPAFWLLGAYFLQQFLNKVLNGISNAVNSIAGELVVNHIKLKIMQKADTVDVADFDRPEFYEKLENANREAGMRPISILHATFRVVSSLISTVGFIAVLISLHPLAPVIIFLLAIPGAWVNYRYRNRNFRFFRWHSKERREMQYFSSLLTNKDAVKEIRIMGLGKALMERYRRVFVDYFRKLRSLICREQVASTVVSLFSLFANLLVFLYVIYRVVFFGGEVGDYSLYTGALSSIVAYVSIMINSTATIYEGTLFIDNMMAFMAQKVTIVSESATPALPVKGVEHSIEFRHVSFRYPGSDRDVLKDISFTVKTGERIVLVGLNGAGKTTLLKLLTRLYDVTEGSILLDGIDLRLYAPDALYDLFGLIFQDFVKYALTLRENVTFGDVRRAEDEARLQSALEYSDAKSFVDALPLKENTPLTRLFEEDGTELSIGQWQKISISRAFYKESDILILDEPTASLDALAEEEVFSRFFAMGDQKISIFVSHRLSGAVMADRILVLEDGRIAEQGDHKTLMAKKGKYYRLFTTQARHYISEDSSSL